MSGKVMGNFQDNSGNFHGIIWEIFGEKVPDAFPEKLEIANKPVSKMTQKMSCTEKRSPAPVRPSRPVLSVRPWGKGGFAPLPLRPPHSRVAKLVQKSMKMEGELFVNRR